MSMNDYTARNARALASYDAMLARGPEEPHIYVASVEVIVSVQDEAARERVLGALQELDKSATLSAGTAHEDGLALEGSLSVEEVETTDDAEMIVLDAVGTLAGVDPDSLSAVATIPEPEEPDYDREVEW